MHGLDPGDDPERPEYQRQRSAATAAHPRMGPRRDPQDGEGDEAADEMIAGRCARRRLEKAVIGLQLCPFASHPYLNDRVRF